MKYSDLTRQGQGSTCESACDQLLEESGATLVEYTLLVVLIAVVVIAAMTNFQLQVSKQYSGVVDRLGGG